MKKIIYLLTAFVIVTGPGCASQTGKSNSAYPVAYREAVSDFPGDRTVDEKTINEFTQFLMSLGQPGAAATARDRFARARPTLAPSARASRALHVDMRDIV